MDKSTPPASRPRAAQPAIPSRPWLITWAVIYIAFLTLDLIPGAELAVSVLKLGGLASAICYAFLYARDHAQPRTAHARANLLHLTALALTLLADLILAINHTSIWGLTIFCCVQFLHLASLSTHRLLPLLLPALTIAALLTPLPDFYTLAAAYALTIISNFTLALVHHHPTLSLGFALFIACDLCVAISFLSTVPYLAAVTSYLAWFFYFPSQILICTSRKSVIK